MKKNRWLYYTVVVAALPILIRFIVYIMMNHHDTIDIFNPVDLVYFGLTLNLSNVNELNSLRLKGRKPIISENEREKLSSWSVIAIAFLCIILGLLYVPNNDQIVFNPCSMLIVSFVLAVTSFFLSLHVINKINSLEV